MKEKAILLGASGLIGSHLLTLLLASPGFGEVTVYVRKTLPISHTKLKQIVTNFKNPDMLNDDISGSIIFCCLGSTKAKTPNLDDYRKVDYDIPLHFAINGLTNNAHQYHLVSAMGANANSSNFYSKMKGDIENAIKALKYETIHIYQPSFLRGDRKENRPMEKILSPIMRLVDLALIGPLKKYQSIEAEDVAKAMYNESIKNKRGIFVHNSEQIKRLV
ncbi:MAG TPA: nucleoside-diphosphate sugar epimerase [Pelobium sp.]|nr:nucleoside-diphosphate sugar epimerase [Pelobium sp.]